MKMARLISYDYIRQKALADPDSGEAIVYLQDIAEVPTVDAAEVVRCRECKWWHEDDDVGHCDNPDGLDNYANPDDFCSYGERKDDGSDG